MDRRVSTGICGVCVSVGLAGPALGAITWTGGGITLEAETQVTDEGTLVTDSAFDSPGPMPTSTSLDVGASANASLGTATAEADATISSTITPNSVSVSAGVHAMGDSEAGFSTFARAESTFLYEFSISNMMPFTFQGTLSTGGNLQTATLAIVAFGSQAPLFVFNDTDGTFSETGVLTPGSYSILGTATAGPDTVRNGTDMIGVASYDFSFVAIPTPATGVTLLLAWAMGTGRRHRQA